MILKNFVIPDRYFDSIFLMNIASSVKKIPKVKEVSVVIGNKSNKDTLRNANLLTEEGEKAEGIDLLIAILAQDDEAVEEARLKIDSLLSQKGMIKQDDEEFLPKSLETALNYLPYANIALISIPGEYVKWEAEKALKNNLNLMIFSDNVSIEDEIYLKKLAQSKGLLVMGPDCGTAIINGVALGFANVVNKGNIGIVGASGTGIQEISSILSNNGYGISHAIGTGGRDLSEKVGGISTLQGINLLSKDNNTHLIILISKPPAKEIEKMILDEVVKCNKKVVVIFLNGNEEEAKLRKIPFASTLEEGAFKAISILKGEEYKYTPFSYNLEEVYKKAQKEYKKLKDEQKFIRGLFSGGTLCYEAMVILKDFIRELYSNIPLNKNFKLKDSKTSIKDSFIDLGDDEFTYGVPHPMIDFNTRNERIIKEALDKETAVLLIDIVLGYGANSNPALAILPAIEEVKKIMDKEKRYISIVASICGTDKDPQNKFEQTRILEEKGVIVMPSNAQATRFACLVAKRGGLNF